jgi:hypothetical protein
MSESSGGYCVDCGHHVDSFDGLTKCPACGSQSLPCADADQITASVNWHELHILCVWAENWQRKNDLGRTVYAIAKRLEAQFPDKPRLTLAAELGEVAKPYELSVMDSALRRDIAEQTGEETGLI